MTPPNPQHSARVPGLGEGQSQCWSPWFPGSGGRPRLRPSPLHLPASPGVSRLSPHSMSAFVPGCCHQVLGSHRGPPSPQGGAEGPAPTGWPESTHCQGGSLLKGDTAVIGAGSRTGSAPPAPGRVWASSLQTTRRGCAGTLGASGSQPLPASALPPGKGEQHCPNLRVTSLKRQVASEPAQRPRVGVGQR